jgi:hypothetical protein
MDTERMFKPALIGGVLLGILSSLPYINMANCCCCAWVIGGGALAAYLYVKDSPYPVSMGNGILIGLFAGVIATVVSSLFLIPLNFLLSYGGLGFAEQFRELAEQMPNMPPETREAIRKFSGRSDMSAILFLLHMVFTLAINCLFAMLGGVIGVAIFEKRKPGDPPDVHASYQPPANLPPANTP